MGTKIINQIKKLFKMPGHKWTPANTLLVNCIGFGSSVEDCKQNLSASLNILGATYGNRELFGYSGHPISNLQADDGTLVYQRYFDFAFVREAGDPESVDIVNGAIE